MLRSLFLFSMNERRRQSIDVNSIDWDRDQTSSRKKNQTVDERERTADSCLVVDERTRRADSICFKLS